MFSLGDSSYVIADVIAMVLVRDSNIFRPEFTYFASTCSSFFKRAADVRLDCKALELRAVLIESIPRLSYSF